MKKSFKVFFFVFISLSIIVSSGIIIKKKIYKENKNKLINIYKLSDDFMDNYFEEVSQYKNDEEKENMLIIVSDKKIKNTYGAEKVIEAPNSQYILKYNSKDEKNLALSKLKNDDYISVEENHIYKVSDSNFNSWGIETMKLDSAITISNDKLLENITVAVIDTGCDINLVNKYYNGKISETYDVLENSTIEMEDTYGHGTHVLGTIAEGTPNNVKIIPIKVSRNGSMYNSDIIAAINYVTRYEKANVINMSLGGKYYDQSMEIAIEAAKEKNIISIAAAGNDNSSSNNYPSALTNTISIASVDYSLNKSSFSNYGSQVTFTAPGTNVKSIMGKNTTIAQLYGRADDEDHVTISGTSMATPHATSAVAILKSYNKDLTLENVIELLKKHAVDLGDEGWDIYYGYGLISFKNVTFCDGDNCDEYNVFKNANALEIKRIEIPYIRLTDYNYFSKNNLFNTTMKVYYSDTEYEEKKLGELDKNGLEIIGYDPYKKEEQEIQIKYGGFTLNETIPYPDNYNSGWEYSIIDDDSIELTLYKGNQNGFKTLYIPEKIDGYNVVSLAGNSDLVSKVFGTAGDYSSFKEIVLPRTLTTLGRASLMGGKYEKVTSSASSISVGEYAFSYATSLKSFDVLISSLGMNAFSNATSIDNIRLANDITVIPNSAFSYCTNLSHITLPRSLTSIGDHSFEGDYKLTNILFPEGLKSIGSQAFYSTNIENLSFPDSLETIGQESFYGSNIRELTISKYLTSIGNDAFGKCGSLESIYVDPDNDRYFSGSSNSLLDLDNMTLLKGIAGTVIPNGIRKIAKGAFSYDLRIEEIEIPSSVEEIGENAFYECNYLKSVKISRGVINIGNNAFKVNSLEEPLTFLTYTDAYAKEYAVLNEINYDTMDPSYIIVDTVKNNYKAFDKVNNNDISSIKLYYDYGILSDSTYKERKKTSGKEEIISEGYTINYSNGENSFRYSDEYYTISGENQYGISYEEQVSVNVSKAIPEYNIPTNLKGSIGQKLSEIALPDGFEWMNPNEIVEGTGNIIYKAKYTPSDITNYSIVENIDVTILVNDNKIIIVPNIKIKNKTYDGTNNISKSDITVSNLNNSDYTIVSVSASSVNVGNTNALVKLKLTDDKFQEYSFDNGMQEKEFTVGLEIEPLKLTKPTKPDGYYTYNGEEICFNILNFDENTMNVVNNKGTNAGFYNTIVSLKDSNYIWNDDTTDNVTIIYEIKKANLNYTDSSSDVTVKYDGNPHTVNISIEHDSNTTLRYMDDSGQYSLSNIPEYIEAGTYVIKYRLYKNDNYNEYLGEKTLNITSNTVINNSTDYEGIYDGENHSISINIAQSDYIIKYSLDNVNYDIDELPTFKDVGEYTIYYKISKEGFDDLKSSNRVKIYGIKKFDQQVKLIDNVIIIKDNSFTNLSNSITTYSLSTNCSHYNKDNQLVTDDNVKTSDIMRIILNESKIYEYNISYLGDTSGDGKINYLDYVNVYNHIQKVKNPESNKKLLTGVYLIAADMSGDNKISYLDYVKIYNKIKELKEGGN